ncbi:SH2 domain-containing protein 4A [Trichomycterus rosablanca]|uniref:SH2 domain-containing protein 4A n=1 Tax=Trichomycterus rosablanca TaxID=2290929 RepID=UPI002F3610C8
MLQQILADMYVDPDILEALNEEQKKTLFLKMREEQVRRWKEREEQEEQDGKKDKPRPTKASYKKVSWLLGRDGDVHVCVIGETDEYKSHKLILSELRQQNLTNFSNCDRPHTTGPSKSSISNQIDQSDNTKPGIELLLKKAAELKELDAQKKATSSIYSQEDETNQENNSDSSNSSDFLDSQSKDLQRPEARKTERYMSIADRLSQRAMQRGTRQPLPVFEMPCLQVPAPTQEKEVVNEQGSSSSNGSRVAQLRSNFNTPNANKPTLCPKPPIPVKPAHLIAAASVR